EADGDGGLEHGVKLEEDRAAEEAVEEAEIVLVLVRLQRSDVLFDLHRPVNALGIVAVAQFLDRITKLILAGKFVFRPFADLQLVHIAADLVPKGLRLALNRLDGEPAAEAVEIDRGLALRLQFAPQMRDNGALDDDVVIELRTGAVVLDLGADF